VSKSKIYQLSSQSPNLSAFPYFSLPLIFIIALNSYSNCFKQLAAWHIFIILCHLTALFRCAVMMLLPKIAETSVPQCNTPTVRKPKAFKIKGSRADWGLCLNHTQVQNTTNLTRSPTFFPDVKWSRGGQERGLHLFQPLYLTSSYSTFCRYAEARARAGIPPS